MLRTWPVRFSAIRLTLSVRSFQVPPTPGTCAWPPSLPSVPTSRATRVTSEANEFSWSTMTLMVFLSSRISPFTSTVIFFDRSPLATAVVTSAMLRTWPVRFSAIRLTLSVRSFHVPPTPSTRAWPPNLPSVPTSRATRVTSEANELSWSTITLMVSLSSRISPFTSTVIFLDRSPRATAVVTSAMLRTWPVRLSAISVDVVGQVLPRAGDALDVGLAAQFAFRADLARDARHFGRERGELLDHRVDDLADAQELAAQRPAVDLDRHRLRQIALGHRADDARDLGGRLGHVVDQLVDRADLGFPAAGGAADPAALADLAFLADDHREPLELVGDLLFHADDFVEQAGDLAVDAGEVVGQPDAEIAAAKPAQGGQEFTAVERIARGHLVQRGALLKARIAWPSATIRPPGPRNGAMMCLEKQLKRGVAG